MKILAFDISSVSTGYSVINNGRLLKSSCGLIKPDAKKSHGARLAEFASELSKLIDKHEPDDIIIEDIFKGRNMNSFKVLAMFRGVAIYTIYNKIGRDPISLMASEARSLVGIPNTKEDVFEFIVNKYKLEDYDVESHNDITDSIALALAAHTMKKKGIDAKSVRNTRRRKKRKRKRNKKSVS